MSWYTRIKTSTLKHASPVGAIRCPNCESPLLVDVNQCRGCQGSAPYDKSGSAYTDCVVCGKVVHFDWEEVAYNVAHLFNVSLAPESIREQVPMAESVKSDESEFADLANMAMEMRPIESV